MRIYLLTFNGAVGWDSYDAHVVIALNETCARNIRDLPCGTECGHRDGQRCAWTDPTRTTCELLGHALTGAAERIVTSSFNAG